MATLGKLPFANTPPRLAQSPPSQPVPRAPLGSDSAPDAAKYHAARDYACAVSRDCYCLLASSVLARADKPQDLSDGFQAKAERWKLRTENREPTTGDKFPPT